MDKFAIIVSAITAFVIGAGGSLGVALVATKGAAVDATVWILAVVLGLVTAAKDVRSLLKFPPVDGGDVPPKPPSASRLPVWLLLGALAMSGCGTLFDSVVTIKDVGDAISREYAQLYKQGLITPEQDAKAEAAHAAYREAMAGLAITLEAAKASGDSSTVPARLRAAKQAIDPLLDLITPLLTKQRGNTLEQQLTKASAQ